MHAMWRNYVTVGLRALAKNKIYAFINIFGLAVGLAACLPDSVVRELRGGYDDWLPNADQVYHIQTFYSANSKLGEQKFLSLALSSPARPCRKTFHRWKRSSGYGHSLHRHSGWAGIRSRDPANGR